MNAIFEMEKSTGARKACKEPGIPKSTLYKAMKPHKPGPQPPCPVVKLRHPRALSLAEEQSVIEFLNSNRPAIPTSGLRSQSASSLPGWFLKAVRDRNLYHLMQFSKIEDYAKARINISSSTTFRLIKLVSYFKNHPVVEKAFLKRKITREQAFQIASLEDGRNERIWLDFAMRRPTRELREEVSRMLRIKEFDYFAPHNYALLPGFRYITDDRYDELSDEMKDIMRTGAWYKGPGSEWPIKADDEYLLSNDLYSS